MARYEYIIDTGTVSVDTQTLLTDVQNEWISIFGPALDIDASTPQGTIITSETISRAAIMKNNADIANTINPNLSHGTFLDAVAAFLGKERGTNSSTVAVNVTVDGDPETVIDEGLRVKTQNGDVFAVATAVMINSQRKASMTIRSVSSGPIPCAVGALQIVDNKYGWGSATVTVDTAVKLGTLARSDAQFKTLRNQTLFAQGLACTGAIKAHLLAVDNVDSVQIIENLSGAAGLYNGITFTHDNGIWVCVSGGASDSDIAFALHAARQGGCPYEYGTNNGTPVQSPNGVPTIDPYSAIVYNVKFTRPVYKDTYVRVVAARNGSAASPLAVANEVKKYADGQTEGEPGFAVGAPISAFEISGAICRVFPGLYVKSVSVAVMNAGVVPVDADFKPEYILKPWEQGIVAIGNISVVIQ